jgi:NAD(P)-dependent dehydrogenase (short-subunit alcohol dehydrogenase family)
MHTVVWISGASSGIGAALADSVPFAAARVIGIGRRPPPRGRHVEADLSAPAAWPRIAAHFREVLARDRADAAVFLHMAGVATPVGPLVTADPDAYTDAVLLNAASGLVLGKGFLEACRDTGARATLVVCSSPAAAAPVYGASHYGAGKSALQYWAATAATEVEGSARVFSVIPFSVDTPMARETMAQPPGATATAGERCGAAEHGDRATHEATAEQIWTLVLDETIQGTAVPVGAVPAEPRCV